MREASATICWSDMSSCHEFSSWSELNDAVTINSTGVTDLIPSTFLILNSELDMEKLQDVLMLKFYSLKGVNVYPWLGLESRPPHSILGIYNSIISYYFNNTPPSEYSCGTDMIPDHASQATLFQLFGEFSISESRYDGEVCPHFFKNAVVQKLTLDGQVASFLYTQLLRFTYQASNTTLPSINSLVRKLNVYGYNYKVDTGLLHPLVFEKVNELTFKATVGSVQTDLFKHFSQLSQVTFYLNSAGKFYHEIGIEWMKSLPTTGVLLEVSGEELYQDDHVVMQAIIYMYPDKDLCLFAGFPQNSSVYLYSTDLGLNCTSTFKWLGRNYFNSMTSPPSSIKDYIFEYQSMYYKNNHINGYF
jgi:hypothetical protein